MNMCPQSATGTKSTWERRGREQSERRNEQGERKGSGKGGDGSAGGLGKIRPAVVSFTWIRLKQERVDARAERRERVLIGPKIEALTGGAEGARVMMMMMTDRS
ncbi:hypothetical protein AOLI_G00282510 [Acnodon oligacanthus]